MEAETTNTFIDLNSVGITVELHALIGFVCWNQFHVSVPSNWL